MPLLVLLGLVLFIAIAVWYSKRVEGRPGHSYIPLNTEEPTVDTQADKPIGFGYKCRWFAVRTDQQHAVAELMGLQNPKAANWKSGIAHAYAESVFVSPPIDGWTLAVGWGLPSGDSERSLEEVRHMLQKLSKAFGEAQFFSTHRTVEHHCWAKASHGKIDRLYAYSGEAGENLAVTGVPTEAEQASTLVNTLSEEVQEQNDLTYPDEAMVMRIAGSWSIDPTALDERQAILGLGLLGKLLKV